MKSAGEQLRMVSWAATGGGIGGVAAGLFGLWGWPAAALFVGASLLAFGVLAAIVAGGERGR